MIEYGIRSFSLDAPANRFVSVRMPSKKLVPFLGIPYSGTGKQILTA